MATLTLKKKITPKPTSKQLVTIATEYLVETYPHLFNDTGMMPIEIGSGKTIRENLPSHISIKIMGRTLAKLCHKYRYLKQIADGGHRTTLDAKIGTQITKHQQEQAKERLDALDARARSKENALLPV